LTALVPTDTVGARLAAPDFPEPAIERTRKVVK
jgi:hypothetical protein